MNITSFWQKSGKVAPLIAKILKNPNGPLTQALKQSPSPIGLGKLPDSLQADASLASVCGYCSTGCSLRVHLRKGEAINLSPDRFYPVNRGMACPKGWEALKVLDSPERAMHPKLRNADGLLQSISWSDAARIFTERFQAIQAKHGPASVAFLGSGQLPTEELAFLGALGKFGMGMLHGDGNTRQCMASAVVAYKQSFGFDAPPYTYRDFEESDTIVLVGSNLCIAHPILWERVMRNPHSPKIIVIDPRRTETAMASTHHYALKPKSDLALFYGLAKLLIDWDAIDRRYIAEHTLDFAAFADHVQGFSLEEVAAQSGLEPQAIEALTRMIADGKRVSFWWTMGVNQSHQGVRTAQALINLALMTGNIGRPGTGANSITGQCNAMGSRLFSNTTNLLGGHDFSKAADREKVAGLLDIPQASIPSQSGYAYDQILDAVERGEIRGLWVVATNGAHSWIDQKRIRKLFDKLDFLVVQDMYESSDTVKHCHLLLPAAAWGEKDGTFINSERRIGRIHKVKRAPAQALPDFAIFRLLADAWGVGKLFADWTDPATVFTKLARLSQGQPCDFSAITSYQQLEAEGGIQWPYRGDARDQDKERRLFADGRFFHADGRARFIFTQPKDPGEIPNEDYPLILLTGRGSSAQWHTETRTKHSAILCRLYRKGAFVEIHPADAARHGLRPEDWVTLHSRRGSVRLQVVISTKLSEGQVFIPMHDKQTNILTHPEFDPESRQPSYKMAAVRLEKILHST